MTKSTECFGLWHDGLNIWYAPLDEGFFWTSSKAVAIAKLQLRDSDAQKYGWRVRSFDEWAKSEGLIE